LRHDERQESDLMRLKATMIALALAGCGEPAEQSVPPPPASLAEAPAAMTIRETLIDCAGAIASEGNVDPLVPPSTGTREENALWTLLALIDKEPGLLGLAGREAAAQARAAWQERPGAERTARSAECIQRFAA
jgi:hypothetical protein